MMKCGILKTFLYKSTTGGANMIGEVFPGARGKHIFVGTKNCVRDIFEGQFVGGANITDGGVNIIGRGRGSWTGFWWGTSLVGREGSQGPNSLVLEIHQSHHICSI